MVPRSIPTTLSLLSNSIWNIGLGYQIRYVLPAVQEASYSGERFAITSSHPTRPNFCCNSASISSRMPSKRAPLRGHSKITRTPQSPCSARRPLRGVREERLLYLCSPISKPSSLSRYSARAIGSRSVRYASFSMAVDSSACALGRALARMKIRMPLPAQRIKSSLEILRSMARFRGRSKKLEIIRVRQKTKCRSRSFFFAFGFSNTKPDCISDSL